MHKQIWPYVWWFFCLKYRIYTVHTYAICMVLANPSQLYWLHANRQSVIRPIGNLSFVLTWGQSIICNDFRPIGYLSFVLPLCQQGNAGTGTLKSTHLLHALLIINTAMPVFVTVCCSIQQQSITNTGTAVFVSVGGRGREKCLVAKNCVKVVFKQLPIACNTVCFGVWWACVCVLVKLLAVWNCV